MRTTHNQGRGLRAAFLAVALSVSIGAFGTANAGAQTTKKHHGFLHRHAGAIAGVGAYEAAKHTGHNRKASGQHRNFAQRHPVLTGIGAGAVAHHIAKKH